MSKYHSQKTLYAGQYFDSAAEARRYQELGLLQAAGEISQIELQPEFVLIYPFTYHGKKYRGVKYRADFKYKTGEWECNGITYYDAVVVEDVKGRRTAAYTIKKQLLLTRYPDINFVEIEAGRPRTGK